MAKEEQYQRVANKKDLKEGGLLKIEPNGRSVVLLWYKLWIRYAHMKVNCTQYHT
jgi:hypothetical protein